MASMLEFINHFHVTNQTVTNWHKRGMPGKKVGGKWDFDLVLCDTWIDQHKGGSATHFKADNDKEKQSLLAEQTRKESAIASLKELELATAREEYISVQEVAQVYADELTNIRTRFLALPSKLAPILLGYDDPRPVQKILLDEVNAILAELSQ